MENGLGSSSGLHGNILAICRSRQPACGRRLREGAACAAGRGSRPVARPSKTDALKSSGRAARRAPVGAGGGDGLSGTMETG